MPTRRRSASLARGLCAFRLTISPLRRLTPLPFALTFAASEKPPVAAVVVLVLFVVNVVGRAVAVSPASARS